MLFKAQSYFLAQEAIWDVFYTDVQLQGRIVKICSREYFVNCLGQTKLTNNHWIQHSEFALFNKQRSFPYHFPLFSFHCNPPSFHLFSGMAHEASLSSTLPFSLSHGVGGGDYWALQSSAGLHLHHTKYQAANDKMQLFSQMAPDAWHRVDRDSQMAEWIFHFPSGCVTWWRCSQSLEPKENASQGDEVLLLFRHLLPAGCYVRPWCNLFSRKQVTL